MNQWSISEKAALATILCVILTFGVCGNLLVMVAISRFKRLRRSMSSYLILNLAISDFITAFLLMPYHVTTVLDVSVIEDNGFLCKAGGILSYPFYICSTLTLVMLAVDRHIALSDPLRYITRVTTRTIAIMISYSWFQAIIFTLLFASFGNIEFSTLSLDCGVTWQGTPLWLSLVALLLTIVLPFILLVILSLRVMFIARKQHRKIALEMPTARANRRKSLFSGLEGKATFTILVVIFVFLLSWTPFLITRGLMIFGIYSSPIVYTSVVWILHLNSVVNVIIYSLRRSDYRKAFIAVLRCKKMSRASDIELSVTRTGPHEITVQKFVPRTRKSNLVFVVD